MSSHRCKNCGKEITACTGKEECASEFCSWECDEKFRFSKKKD